MFILTAWLRVQVMMTTPDLALVDSEYRDVVWIDVKHPSQWDRTLYDQLNEAWRGSENIDHYYQDEVSKTNDTIITKSDKIQNLKDSLEIIKLQKKIDSLKKKQ